MHHAFNECRIHERGRAKRTPGLLELSDYNYFVRRVGWLVVLLHAQGWGKRTRNGETGRKKKYVNATEISHTYIRAHSHIIFEAGCIAYEVGAARADSVG